MDSISDLHDDNSKILKELNTPQLMRRTEFVFPVSTLAGSNLKNIFALYRHHRVEPRYLPKFCFTVLVAGIFEIFALYERIRWQRRIRHFRPAEPPVFIIGFWRSGTTLLHNLMCRDPNAAYTTTFHTVFPHLVLTQSWWLKPIINYFLPAQRPFDEVSMDTDYPQEEEFGMMNLQFSTIYKFFVFPSEFDQIIQNELFTEEIDPELLRNWETAFSGMVAKACFNTGGSRFIGKNPCNLARINLLKKMYPGAKFIFIHRNPYMVVESLYRFILSIFPGTQLQDVPATFTRENVVMLYKQVMESYLQDRSFLDPKYLVEIRMDEFVREKTKHLEHIYDKFGLGDFTYVQPNIEKYLDQHDSPPRASFQPSPETVKLVNLHLKDIMDKLEYDVMEEVTLHN